MLTHHQGWTHKQTSALFVIARFTHTGITRHSNAAACRRLISARCCVHESVSSGLQPQPKMSKASVSGAKAAPISGAYFQHRRCPQTAAAAAAAAIAGPRRAHQRSSCAVAALQVSQTQLSQHQSSGMSSRHLLQPTVQQDLPVIAPWPVSQLNNRCSVVAAAGRRRKQDAAAPQDDDEPAIDMDDVMYDDVGVEEPEADLLEGDDAAGDFEEFEDDEEDADDDDDFDDAEDEETLPGDEEDWAAALDDFDPSLDVQPEQAPTKEEQELAAAKALVGYSDDSAKIDGTTLTVSELPPEQPERPKTFQEKTVALTAQDRQTLEQNMASYTIFPLYDLELLVSSTPDGLLSLADCFCLDTLEDSFSRPDVAAGVPSTPGLYQIIPWEHTRSADVLKNKEAEVMRMKLYFVGLDSSQEVDMSRIYSFDVNSRQMADHTPNVLGAERHEDMEQPVMRIREDGVWIEEAAELPGMYFIAEGFAGHPLERYNNPDKEFDMYEFVRVGLWDKPRSMEELKALEAGAAVAAGSTAALTAAEKSAVAVAAQEADFSSDVESQLEERLEELELMEELDDMPDVPAVDMM